MEEVSDLTFNVHLFSDFEMASSSNSYRKSSSVVKFRNRTCWCGAKAEVKISESRKNPKKLYYCCRNDKCEFFDWCIEEFESNVCTGTAMSNVHVGIDGNIDQVINNPSQRGINERRSLDLKQLEANVSSGNTLLFGICCMLGLVTIIVFGILLKM